MSDSFVYVCGSCFVNIREGQGVVLNCGDFLCTRCSSQFHSCPLCNKENVAKLPLNSPDKPIDVAIRMSSATSLMENLHSAIEFQSKSYTRIIRRLCTERASLIKKAKALEDRVQELQSYQMDQDAYRPSTSGSMTSNYSISPSLWNGDNAASSRSAPPFLSQSNAAIEAWQRPLRQMLITNGPTRGGTTHSNLDGDFGNEYRDLGGQTPSQQSSQQRWSPLTNAPVGDAVSLSSTPMDGPKRLRSPAALYALPPNKTVTVSQQQFQRQQLSQSTPDSHSAHRGSTPGAGGSSSGNSSGQVVARPGGSRQPQLLRAPSPSAGWLQSRPATPNPRS